MADGPHEVKKTEPSNVVYDLVLAMPVNSEDETAVALSASGNDTNIFMDDVSYFTSVATIFT